MKRNNYRYGKISLIVLFFGLPLAVWFSGWRQVVFLWQAGKRNDTELQKLRKHRGMSEDTLSGHLKKGVLLRDGRLLEQVRQWGEMRGVTVLGYSPWLSGDERGWKLYTAEVSLTGGFLPMLEVLAASEQDGIRPVAARFLLHTDTRNRKKQLQLTLWIQQITEE